MATSDEQKRTNAEGCASMVHVCHLAGHEIAPMDGDYDFDIGEPLAGKHYWVSKCPNCSGNVPYFEDRTNGQIGNILKGRGSFRAECPSCHAPASTLPQMLRSEQWPER